MSINLQMLGQAISHLAFPIFWVSPKIRGAPTVDHAHSSMSASAHAAHSRSLNRFSLLCHKYICVRVSIFPNVSNFFASIRSQSRTVDIAHTQYADRLRITHALMEFRLTPRTVYVVFFFPSLPHLHSIKSYYRWCRLLKKKQQISVV